MSEKRDDRVSASYEVTRTVFAKEKILPQAAQICPWVEVSYRTADSRATEETRALFARLQAAASADVILFGHQNAGHIGVSIERRDGTDSDVLRICGRHPAVVGIDALSLLGFEGNFDHTVEVTKALHRQGVIVTFSMHAPNFAVCDADLGGYSPNVTEPQIAEDCLPGGLYHERFRAYLDRIADYALLAVDDDGRPIPMIFRPFHENNGNWFWWGAAYTTPALYRELFRYTLHYLREEKGIHQFLYAYSPNGPFADEEDYLSRYPGDDAIDIVGFDMYHDRPTAGDAWIDTLVATCRIVASIARERKKVAAVTEAGLRMLDTAADGKYYEGLAPIGNPRPDWFNECADAILRDPLACRVAYFLVWANFSKEQFWVPYLTDEKHGHEMIDPFTRFLNRPDVLLAGEILPG